MSKNENPFDGCFLVWDENQEGLAIKENNDDLGDFDERSFLSFVGQPPLQEEMQLVNGEMIWIFPLVKGQAGRA